MLAALLTLGALGLPAQPGDDAALAWRAPDPRELEPVVGVAWKADLGTFELLATNHEEWTRPVISPDHARVYIGTREGRLEARALDDGRELWSRTDLGAIGADMVEHRGVVAVGSDSDLVGFARADGEERWRVEVGGRIGGPIAQRGRLALLPIRPNAFVAVDLEAGTRLWQAKRATPDNLTVRGQAGAAIDPERGVAYLGFSDGALLAVSLEDGSTRWVASLGDASEFFADVDTTPVLLDGGASLLVAAYNTELFRLEAERGAIEWSRPLPRLISLTRAPGDRVVASQGDGQVLGLEPTDGDVMWRYRLEEGAPSRAVLLAGGNRVAVSGSRGPISILAVDDGRPLQLIAPGSGASVPPAVGGRSMVLFSNDGLVLALREGKTGAVIIR
jgi:outer membrane protein assembly factor BamB